MTDILFAACLLLALGLAFALFVIVRQLKGLRVLDRECYRLGREILELRYQRWQQSTGPWVNNDIADDPISGRARRQKPYGVPA